MWCFRRTSVPITLRPPRALKHVTGIFAACSSFATGPSRARHATSTFTRGGSFSRNASSRTTVGVPPISRSVMSRRIRRMPTATDHTRTPPNGSREADFVQVLERKQAVKIALGIVLRRPQHAGGDQSVDDAADVLAVQDPPLGELHDRVWFAPEVVCRVVAQPSADCA